MPIKHLVITGGGPYGLCSFGILGHLKEQGVFDPDQIESVYATSIGCMVGLFMVLKNISYEEIREYVIHKPVCEQFALTSDHIFNLYSNKGVYDGIDVVKRFLEPIFHAENISPEVTMREFYEHSGVSLNFICSDVNNGFAEYRISHDTHPDLPIYKAIAASASIPMVFYPVHVGDACLVDGGAVANYPLHICVENNKGCDPSEIIGIRNMYTNSPKVVVTEDSTILTYVNAFVVKMMTTLDMTYRPDTVMEIEYDIPIVIDGRVGILDKDFMTDLMNHKEARDAQIERGFDVAKAFIANMEDGDGDGDGDGSMVEDEITHKSNHLTDEPVDHVGVGLGVV
jgi:predicted acylesterase/phospholipase RssA